MSLGPTLLLLALSTKSAGYHVVLLWTDEKAECALSSTKGKVLERRSMRSQHEAQGLQKTWEWATGTYFRGKERQQAV